MATTTPILGLKKPATTDNYNIADFNDNMDILDSVGGGGWTYVTLSTSETTTATANSNTLLKFTPLANKKYEVEGKFYLQSGVTTTGVRPGIKWPTVGITQNAAFMISPTSATAFASRFWGTTAAANVASTGVAVINEGFYGKLEAIFVTGGTVTGDFIVTLASEIASTEVRIMANSFIRYREI